MPNNHGDGEIFHAFAHEWPITVRISTDWPEAHAWLLARALLMDKRPGEIFTSAAFREYRFKDERIATEFKLRFG